MNGPLSRSTAHGARARTPATPTALANAKATLLDVHAAFVPAPARVALRAAPGGNLPDPHLAPHSRPALVLPHTRSSDTPSYAALAPPASATAAGHRDALSASFHTTKRSPFRLHSPLYHSPAPVSVCWQSG